MANTSRLTIIMYLQPALPYLLSFAEQLAASITTEIRRLRRRRSRPTSTAQTSQSDSSDGEQLSSNSSTTSVTMSQSTAQQSKDNTPLFTFKYVPFRLFHRH